MKKIFINFKPNLWCLLIHQCWWNYQDSDPDIQYCGVCDKFFFYPTKKEHEPVYK